MDPQTIDNGLQAVSPKLFLTCTTKFQMHVNYRTKKSTDRKIKKTENEDLLGEAYRLLELETMDLDVYKLNSEQKAAVAEAKQQIKDGQSLTNEQANREIDESLKK